MWVNGKGIGCGCVCVFWGLLAGIDPAQHSPLTRGRDLHELPIQLPMRVRVGPGGKRAEPAHHPASAATTGAGRGGGAPAATGWFWLFSPPSSHLTPIHQTIMSPVVELQASATYRGSCTGGVAGPSPAAGAARGRGGSCVRPRAVGRRLPVAVPLGPRRGPVVSCCTYRSVDSPHIRSIPSIPVVALHMCACVCTYPRAVAARPGQRQPQSCPTKAAARRTRPGHRRTFDCAACLSVCRCGWGLRFLGWVVRVLGSSGVLGGSPYRPNVVSRATDAYVCACIGVPCLLTERKMPGRQLTCDYTSLCFAFGTKVEKGLLYRIDKGLLCICFGMKQKTTKKLCWGRGHTHTPKKPKPPSSIPHVSTNWAPATESGIGSLTTRRLRPSFDPHSIHIRPLHILRSLSRLLYNRLAAAAAPARALSMVLPCFTIVAKLKQTKTRPAARPSRSSCR